MKILIPSYAGENGVSGSGKDNHKKTPGTLFFLCVEADCLCMEICEELRCNFDAGSGRSMRIQEGKLS